MEPQLEPMRDYEPIQPRGLDWRGLLRRIWAPIGVVVTVLVKFSFVAFKFFGIFISVAAYALIWGWRFAAGLVLLILIHELGHYAEARRQGLHPTIPMFVPFIGAFVMHRQASDPWRGAKIALAGPLAGALGALGCWELSNALNSRLLQALAYFGFFLNLFNLIPFRPFDGGAVVNSARILRHAGTYNGRSSAPRALAVWGLYLGLGILLALGMWATHVSQHRL